MRQAVRDSFFDFTAEREGFTPFMYCDTLNLVTTGIGNLIDAGVRNGHDTSAAAMTPAMGLPWKERAGGWTSKNPVAGARVSEAQIADAWKTCKLHNQEVPGFEQRGGFAYAGLTNITLDLEGMKQLFNSTMNRFDTTLSNSYPGYESLPADAQLAMMSMAWAMGPGYRTKFPQFSAAIDRLDLDAAADLSFFQGGGGTLGARQGRNAQNFEMFTTAAAVIRQGSDPDVLHFIKKTPVTPSSNGGAGSGVASISSTSTLGSKLATITAVAGVATLGYSAYRWHGHVSNLLSFITGSRKRA